MDTNLPESPTQLEEDLLVDLPPDYKLFSLNQMIGGSVFGGPFAGTYMIVNNMRKLNSPIPGWKVWMAIFGVLAVSLTPDFLGIENIPGIFYNIAYCAAVYWMAKYFIGYEMKNHEESGGPYWGMSKVLGVVVVSILLFVGFAALVLILMDFEGFKELFL